VRLLPLLFLPAVAYQVLAIFACGRHIRRQRTRARNFPVEATFAPSVSVLKPLRGLDPNTAEAFLSQCRQRYPQFEVLFGVAAEDDPAIPFVRRLEGEFPSGTVRLIIGRENLQNGKVAVLANLAKHARYPVWVVNDSDIKVTPEYLATVVRPLADADVGVVTCLYRAEAHTPASAWEALGIATDFMPSTLVAQLIGVREFGLGSTLAFRAEDLAQAGGFQAIGDFIADDYQLARQITRLGKRCLVSPYVVETSLGEDSWVGVWRHQLRWARTIRASKGGGYAGLPIAQAGLWIAVAAALQLWPAALCLLLFRWTSALLASLTLGSRSAARWFWLTPAWDVYSFAIWATSYAGREVRWRDRWMEIDAEGRIRNVGKVK
jgi:ceramide glucosyltransferase